MSHQVHQTTISNLSSNSVEVVPFQRAKRKKEHPETFTVACKLDRIRQQDIPPRKKMPPGLTPGGEGSLSVAGVNLLVARLSFTTP